MSKLDTDPTYSKPNLSIFSDDELKGELGARKHNRIKENKKIEEQIKSLQDQIARLKSKINVIEEK